MKQKPYSKADPDTQFQILISDIPSYHIYSAEVNVAYLVVNFETVFS